MRKRLPNTAIACVSLAAHVLSLLGAIARALQSSSGYWPVRLAQWRSRKTLSQTVRKSCELRETGTTGMVLNKVIPKLLHIVNDVHDWDDAEQKKRERELYKVDASKKHSRTSESS